jgi:HPt (histidine-containing phosphotransfer) domain-containing protein
MAELEKLCSTIEGELAQSKDANARLMSACDYLERELEEVTKQRDELAKALKSLCRAIISEEQHGITGLLKRSEAFLSAVKGGQHE